LNKELNKTKDKEAVMKKIIILLSFLLLISFCFNTNVYCKVKTYDNNGQVKTYDNNGQVNNGEVSATPNANVSTLYPVVKTHYKLDLITQEIETTEQKMSEAGGLILGAPIVAGLAAVVISKIETQDSNANSNLHNIVSPLALLIGGIVTGIGVLQYWDGVNTIGQLRAKKYDLMFYPFIKNENLADKNINVLGLTLQIRI
jgi:hypothetical protein